jgi:hypothetical protein
VRPSLLDAGLPGAARGLFTTRIGGISPPPWAEFNLARHVQDEPARVNANRRLLANDLGVPPDRLAFAEQVHGAGVVIVDEPQPGRPSPFPGVDALATTIPGVALVVLAADCLPVLLADPVAGVIAAAHAGRQGLLAGVLPATVRAMIELGAEPARMAAVLGPAVCGRCYELPAELADRVGAGVPGSRSTSRRGKPSVDLAAGARAQLMAAGLGVVRDVGRCTLEDEQLFSYRREGRTGRHAGAVVLGQ